MNIESSLRDYAGTTCLVYPASRPLEASEAAALLAELNLFLSDWASHGSPVTGAAALLENRFVIVAHKPLEIAGCSRDSLLFFMKDAGEKRGIQWLGGARVFYKADDGEINGEKTGQVLDVDRPEFRRLASEGVVTPDTIVFDTTVRETDGILSGKFALPARESWHARLLPQPTPA